MSEALKVAMLAAQHQAQHAATTITCAQSWLKPFPGEKRNPRAMMRRLLAEAEAQAELALQFIRQAQEALPKRGKGTA